MTHTIRAAAAALAAILTASACTPAEDPARVQLRERLTREAPLTPDELGRTLDEVARTLEGKVVRFEDAEGSHDLDAVRQDAILSILTHRAGVFDEGLRTAEGVTLRVINAPAVASNPELDAARRLLIDTATLLPRRFEFISGVPSDEYTLDLVVAPSP